MLFKSWANTFSVQKIELKVAGALALATACMGILESNENGIFHISGPETMSIYQIVERIAKHFNYNMENVSKISSSTLSQPAKRPPKTGFDLSKAYSKINYSPRTLEETLSILYGK